MHDGRCDRLFQSSTVVRSSRAGFATEASARVVGSVGGLPRRRPVHRDSWDRDIACLRIGDLDVAGSVLGIRR